MNDLLSEYHQKEGHSTDQHICRKSSRERVFIRHGSLTFLSVQDGFRGPSEPAKY